MADEIARVQQYEYRQVFIKMFYFGTKIYDFDKI